MDGENKLILFYDNLNNCQKIGKKSLNEDSFGFSKIRSLSYLDISRRKNLIKKFMF